MSRHEFWPPSTFNVEAFCGSQIKYDIPTTNYREFLTLFASIFNVTPVVFFVFVFFLFKLFYLNVLNLDGVFLFLFFLLKTNKLPKNTHLRH